MFCSNNNYCLFFTFVRKTFFILRIISIDGELSRTLELLDLTFSVSTTFTEFFVILKLMGLEPNTEKKYLNYCRTETLIINEKIKN